MRRSVALALCRVGSVASLLTLVSVTLPAETISVRPDSRPRFSDTSDADREAGMRIGREFFKRVSQGADSELLPYFSSSEAGYDGAIYMPAPVFAGLLTKAFKSKQFENLRVVDFEDCERDPRLRVAALPAGRMFHNRALLVLAVVQTAGKSQNGGLVLHRKADSQDWGVYGVFGFDVNLVVPKKKPPGNWRPMTHFGFSVSIHEDLIPGPMSSGNANYFWTRAGVNQAALQIMLVPRVEGLVLAAGLNHFFGHNMRGREHTAPRVRFLLSGYLLECLVRSSGGGPVSRYFLVALETPQGHVFFNLFVLDSEYQRRPDLFEHLVDSIQSQ